MIQLRQPCAVPINCASIFFALAIITRDKIRCFFIPSRFDITSAPPPMCLSEPAASSILFIHPLLLVSKLHSLCNSCRERDVELGRQNWFKQKPLKGYIYIYIRIYFFFQNVNLHTTINRMQQSLLSSTHLSASDRRHFTILSGRRSNPNLYYNAGVKCASSATFKRKIGRIKIPVGTIGGKGRRSGKKLEGRSARSKRTNVDSPLLPPLLLTGVAQRYTLSRV